MLALELGDLLKVGIHRAQRRQAGFTSSQCWSVDLDDGRRVFVKVAVDDAARSGNRAEATVLGAVRSPHMPTLIAATEDARLLVTEDLSDADWEPHIGDIEGLWAALAAVGSLRGPEALPTTYQGTGRDPWSEVVADERFAPATGLDRVWLATNASALSEAAKAADTSGDRLVHGDLGPGNWSRTRDGPWKFVDWASAYRGNPIADDAIAAVRLTHARGEPCPSPRLIAHPEMAALIGGRFAGELLDVDWSDAPPAARRNRVADIVGGLMLCADLLGLSPPNRS